jgi:hypothetical protein
MDSSISPKDEILVSARVASRFGRSLLSDVGRNAFCVAA